jgi:hypothetical protein
VPKVKIYLKEIEYEGTDFVKYIFDICYRFRYFSSSLLSDGIWPFVEQPIPIIQPIQPRRSGYVRKHWSDTSTDSPRFSVALLRSSTQ